MLQVNRQLLRETPNILNYGKLHLLLYHTIITTSIENPGEVKLLSGYGNATKPGRVDASAFDGFYETLRLLLITV